MRNYDTEQRKSLEDVVSGSFSTKAPASNGDSLKMFR